MTWRLADRTLDLTQPLGAGIVNVTADSMFEGARSVTPEQAITDGRALVEAGFDMLDVGAAPNRQRHRRDRAPLAFAGRQPLLPGPGEHRADEVLARERNVERQAERAQLG